MPHVRCPSCGLASYAVVPHSAPSLCPYCDAELFPALRPAPGGADEADAEVETEAA